MYSASQTVTTHTATNVVGWFVLAHSGTADTFKQQVLLSNAFYAPLCETNAKSKVELNYLDKEYLGNLPYES